MVRFPLSNRFEHPRGKDHACAPWNDLLNLFCIVLQQPVIILPARRVNENARAKSIFLLLAAVSQFNSSGDLIATSLTTWTSTHEYRKQN